MLSLYVWGLACLLLKLVWVSVHTSAADTDLAGLLGSARHLPHISSKVCWAPATGGHRDDFPLFSL
jgi:hypothetical protein